jgi:catechol 2,3-dioxygenase-like lactoylglutathione lyase family enzyme
MTNDDAVPVRFDVVALDTADPPRLAAFYTALLGWEVERADDDWITIGGGTGARLAFQLAPDHQAPTWPDPAVPQQIHLDLSVDDLEAASRFAESLGARRVEGPGEAEDFVVFLDPSGHPFCLCV